MKVFVTTGGCVPCARFHQIASPPWCAVWIGGWYNPWRRYRAALPTRHVRSTPNLPLFMVNRFAVGHPRSRLGTDGGEPGCARARKFATESQPG